MVKADDQRLLANGLARIIGVQPDMEVVGEAHTGEEAISLCLNEEPDVVLMDLSMPGMGGLRAARVLWFREDGGRRLALQKRLRER